MITWIFDEGSFRPSAKLVGEKRYSIITDYLGTPTQMFDEHGELSWEADYDIYGKIHKLHVGSLGDCPFRYQGQYEDVETGLYYNRFRYYDAASGIYVSQDPIRLSGKNPNFYAHVPDVNKYIDIFGLDFFYQLVKDDKVVYNGITKNPVEDRMADHVRDPSKDFTEFKYIEVDDRIASRDLEGSALHNADGQGLQNATRLDGQYYHSYDPDNLKSGRTYYTSDKIDVKMKNANTGKIENGKVKLNCA